MRLARVNQRYTYSIPARVSKRQVTERVTIWNLSPQGAFAQINTPFYPGERLQLKLFPAGADPIEIKAQVRWRQSKGQSSEGLDVSGMGLLIIDAPSAFTDLVQSLGRPQTQEDDRIVDIHFDSAAHFLAEYRLNIRNAALSTKKPIACAKEETLEVRLHLPETDGATLTLSAQVAYQSKQTAKGETTNLLLTDLDTSARKMLAAYATSLEEKPQSRWVRRKRVKETPSVATSGSLTKELLVDILHTAHEKKQSGELILSNKGQTLTFLLYRGKIYSALRDKTHPLRADDIAPSFSEILDGEASFNLVEQPTIVDSEPPILPIGRLIINFVCHSFSVENIWKTVELADDLFVVALDESSYTKDDIQPTIDEERLLVNLQQPKAIFELGSRLRLPYQSIIQLIFALYSIQMIALGKKLEDLEKEDEPPKATDTKKLPVSGADRETAENHFKHGLGLFKNNDFVLAEKAFYRATKIMPDNATYMAYFGYCLLLVSTERRKQAIEKLELALTIDPRCEIAHYFLALAAKSSNDLQRAIYHLRFTIKINPQNQKARKLLQTLESTP